MPQPVRYSKKYSVFYFGISHKRYCEKHGIDPHTVDIDELNKTMAESRRAQWREKSKLHYEKNAEKIRGAVQKNREEHREEILAQKKIYAQKKFTCECGCEVARKNLARHLESDKHRKLTHSKPSPI